MAKKNKKWGGKTIAGPANRSASHSNGKRRELKAIETRTRRQGRNACREDASAAELGEDFLGDR